MRLSRRILMLSLKLPQKILKETLSTHILFIICKCIQIYFIGCKYFIYCLAMTQMQVDLIM